MITNRHDWVGYIRHFSEKKQLRLLCIVPVETSVILRSKIWIKKDFRVHYKCAFKKILESHHFWLTEVIMFNSGDHTVLTFCIIQFIILICLSPEKKYLENLSKEYK